MRKVKITHISFVLIAMAFGIMFHPAVLTTQVSAVTIIRSPSAYVTTRIIAPGSKFKVKIVMGNDIKNLKITSKNKKLKVVKYHVKKKTREITITFQLAETATAGSYKAVINNNGKTKIVNAKVKKGSVQSNVNSIAPSSLNIVGRQLSLGSSLSEVQSQLQDASMIKFDESKGINSYDTDCYYYFNEDFDKNGDAVYSVGCMVEFYNGALDRVIFGSKDWSFGKLSNSTKLKEVSVVSNNIRNVSGSENYTYKSHTESYSHSAFTMYYDNQEEWKSPSWCLCEWKSTVSHSGKNSLKGKTMAMKLNKIIMKAFIEKDFPELKKSSLTKAFKKMDAFAIESGKQVVQLQNIYRVYHGLYPAVYSSDLAELAYAKAYIRSKLGVQGHLQPFVGNLTHDIIQNVGHSIRINEWWSGCAAVDLENVGTGISSPLHETLTTIASTPHLETMIYGGFAAGSVILDGYSQFQGVLNGKMTADEIEQERKLFLDILFAWSRCDTEIYGNYPRTDDDAFSIDIDDYDETNPRHAYDPDGVYYDKIAYQQACDEYEKKVLYGQLGITFDEISPALVNYFWYIDNDLYELAFLNKEDWIDFKITKYHLKDNPGIEKFLALQYDNEIDSLNRDVYSGYDEFVDDYNELGEPSGHNARVERGELTKEQLIQVYLHFCEQVYDTDFTNALSSHFHCSTKDVYIKHSNVLVELIDEQWATLTEFEFKEGYVANIVYREEDEDDELSDEIRLSSGFLRVDYQCYYDGRRIDYVELKKGYTNQDVRIYYIFSIADKYEISHQVAASVWTSHLNKTAIIEEPDLSYFDGYL